MKITDRLPETVKAIQRRGLLQLTALTMAIQGASLISQALSAIVVTPAGIGGIRTFESSFSVLVLCASFGAPSLAIREVAAESDPQRCQTIIGDLCLLPAIGAIGFAVVIGVVASLGILGHVLPARLLFATVGLIWLVNLTRFLAALAQGLRETEKVYLPVVIASVAAIACHVTGAWQGALPGWLAGRYAGEILLIMAIGTALRTRLSIIRLSLPLDFGRILRLMQRATVVNLALIVRMATDAAPLLILTILYRRPDAAGQFGVASLLLVMTMLPVAILTQHALPSLSVIHGSAQALRDARRKLLRTVAAVGSGGAFATAVMAQLLYFGGPAKYGQAFMLGSVLALAIPFKAIAAADGTHLLAAGRYRPPLIANIGELILVVAIALGAGAGREAWWMTGAVVAGSIFSAAALVISSDRAPTSRSNLRSSPEIDGAAHADNNR